MKKVFDTLGGNFEACHEAEAWCRERCIAVGRMAADQPRGLLFGYYNIAKWHNLSGPERRELDGTMTGDMRHGPVIVELQGEEADYPLVSEELQDE